LCGHVARGSGTEPGMMHGLRRILCRALGASAHPGLGDPRVGVSAFTMEHNGVTREDQSRKLRVLVLTNRHIYRTVSYGMVRDFEDTVAKLNDADVLHVPLPSRRARLAALKVGTVIKPVEAPRSDYDMCLFVAMEPQWVPALSYVRDLDRIARKRVVYLFDSWIRDTAQLQRHRKSWGRVDHAFISFGHALEAYRTALDCNVHYLPQAADERWFSPGRPERPIDVISIGRRHPKVHAQLLELAGRDDLFYYYQTARSPEAIDLQENQRLVGRLLQSARVHVGWSVESTDPARAEGGAPITARWFESAASGGIVVGRAPANPEFKKLFPYDGFVREIDPDSPADTQQVVRGALDGPSDQAERSALAEHVRMNHTWRTRWYEIVRTSGL
jgi:hypothetical protein